MALTDRWLPIRLQFGVETEQDEKTLVPGQPTSLENAVFTRRVTVVKRFGNRSLSRTRLGIGGVYSEVSGCTQLASRDDGNDLVMFGDSNRVIYSDARTDEVLSYDDNRDAWVPRGTWTPLHQQAKDLPHGAMERWDGTQATAGGVKVVAWEDARGGVYAQLFNADTMVPYGRDFRIGGSLTRSPRALSVGGQLLVFMVSGTTPNSLHVGRINAADPSAGTANLTQLHTSMWAQAPYYDVAAIGSSPNTAMFVVSQSGSLYAAVVNSNGVIESSGSSVPGPNPISGTYGTAVPPALAVSPDGQCAFVAYKAFAPLSGVQGWFISVPSLATLSDSGAVDTNPVTNGYGTVNRLGATYISSFNNTYEFQAVVEVSASDATDRYLRTANATSDVGTSYVSGNLIRHSTLSSMPFLMGGRPYAWKIGRAHV